jgi:hypothetical protein
MAKSKYTASKYKVDIFTGKRDGNGDPILRKGSVVELATLVAASCSAGLCSGIGSQSGKPGTMCVEAAVSYAQTGDANNDHPECVSSALADLKIQLNDWDGWKSKKQRGRVLKRIAIAQLGTYTKGYSLGWCEFSEALKNELAKYIFKKFPKMSFYDVVRVFAGDWGSIDSDANETFLLDVYTALRGGYSQKAHSVKLMSDLIECAVQALIKLKTPGSTYLHLAK